MRRIRLPGLALLLGLALVLFTPAGARAHAFVVQSSPEETGARLGTAPGAVVLTFSEAIQPGLSRAVVTTPDGQSASGSGRGTAISVPLATNAPGVYRVTWKVVSADDGHTTSGSFRFTVGSLRGRIGAGSTGTPAWQSVLFAVGRTVEYTALLLAAGLLLLHWLARRREELAWMNAQLAPRLRVALLIAFASTLTVVIGEAAIAEGSLSVGSLSRYLSEGLPGAARLALLACEALALASVPTAAILWPVAGALVLGSLVAVAAASHAAGVHPVVVGVAVDALHLVAAALWAGGILALVTIRPPEGWRGPAGRRLLDRFSTVAVPAFLVSVAFGAVQGLQEVRGTLSRMVTTSYGKVLLLKAAAIGMMLPLSWSAWRRRVFRRAEGAVAAAVVTIAAVLSVLPVPNTPAHGSAQQRASALPRPGELTLGGDAGQFLVGLSLQPAKPGNDLVLVYLQPIEGSGAGVPVRLFIGGRSIPTGECGTNCRSARLIIQGGERIALNIGGPKGGKAVFEIPRLPPADGSPILELMQRRMHALRSLRIHETLSSGLGGTVTAEYSLQAPDRMEIVVQEGGSGSHTVWIGGTRYLKQGLHGQWHVERGGLSTQVPSFIWDYFQPFRDARVVGGQSVNGVPTRIVAFYGESGGTPVWFRLWIDRSGLVRRDEMRAFGHFMNHRYYGFDRPVTIRPPVKG